ncbi:hypothetical protein [Paenibacillus pinistramenti]|uniref:hypothetical protein n=1 Tax=Paenibacillus pinistramenti TaxID=1768003 RepID=UPI001109B423|nr:hypothetical protein [Paenibacillus pinistramenti]
MKNFKVSKKVTKLLLSALFVFPLAGEIAVPPAAEAIASSTLEENAAGQPSAPAEVQQFAGQVIRFLSSQESFSKWKDSIAAYNPLGPGTHGWLVSLVSSGHEPVGYLIIGAKPDGGLALVEYGTGSDPLYNPGRLHIDPGDKLGLLYGGPALTQWSVTKPDGQSVYLEAANGETLPDTDADWLARSSGLPLNILNEAAGTSGSSDSSDSSDSSGSSGEQAGQKVALPLDPVQSGTPFRPDDNLLWMTSESVTLTPAQFNHMDADPGEWVYFTSGPARTYAQSLPISGYQQWYETDGYPVPSIDEPIIYLISRTENRTRYILFNALSETGEFKAWTGR